MRLFFPPFLWHFVYVLVHVKDQLKRSKSTPAGTPLSHRLPCSWNASSVAPPLILWRFDIRVTYLLNVYIAALAHKNSFGKAALLSLAVLAQACVGWPLREGLVFRRRVLKRRELKQSLSDREGIHCCSTGQYEKTDVLLSIKVNLK